MKIKKNDIVKIISGNDKGKQGKVLSVFPDAEKVVVEGMNIRKKHVRPKRQGQKGELVRIPAAFSVSRVMLVCTKCKRSVRVRHRDGDRGKVRVCTKCNTEL